MSNITASSFYADAISSMFKFKPVFGYNASGSVEYMGLALPGTSTSSASWMIVKLLYDADGNMIEGRHINGVAEFSFVWDNRATYTYI